MNPTDSENMIKIYRRRRIAAVIAISLLGATETSTRAVEPNDTFGESTILGAGVLLVADDLFPAPAPDTLLGSRTLFGGIGVVDDDGSPEGDGRASALFGVPTNSGSVSFSVTGFGDDSFVGAHGESGLYATQVIVRDFFGDTVDEFFEVRDLSPGTAHDYDYSDFSYLNGTYDVIIDNVIGGDVDFFTFTGLVAGEDFTARTLAPDDAIDTVLGWFDDSGSLVDENDDDVANNSLLSVLEGVVPASGQLTFAVTGFGDFDYSGRHLENSPYDLQLILGDELDPGDFDGDGDVDGADFLKWQRDDRTATGLIAWQDDFGKTALVASAMQVPEPAALSVSMLAACCALCRRKRVLRGISWLNF